MWIFLLIIVIVVLLTWFNKSNKLAYQAERQRRNIHGWSKMQTLLPVHLRNREAASFSDAEIDEISAALRQGGTHDTVAYDIARGLYEKRDGNPSRWNMLFGPDNSELKSVPVANFATDSTLTNSDTEKDQNATTSLDQTVVEQKDHWGTTHRYTFN